jgi:hypothetical protein
MDGYALRYAKQGRDIIPFAKILAPECDQNRSDSRFLRAEKSHDADPGTVLHVRELCPRGRVVLADEENCVAVALPDGEAPLLLMLMLLNRTFERFALPNAMLELHVKMREPIKEVGSPWVCDSFRF